MIAFKKVSAILSFSIIISAYSFSSSHAEEKIKIDPSILKVINEIVTKMQQKTMASIYAEMPFKGQMRGKMMTERASQNYMMHVIQPQMMQKNMGAEKLRLMNKMSQF
uniref:hypothetical protein n=1 Tax=Candidatus Electronema sp. TaxID=2698783 RepID=UPI0040561A36